MNRSVRFLLVLCMTFSGAAAVSQSLLTPERRAAVEHLYTISAERGPQAVDEHLESLAPDERLRLEADFWIYRREAKEITRSEFASRMLELNERLAPADWRTLDYWRYVRMLAAKVDKGTMDVEEMQYLAGRRLREIEQAREDEWAERDRVLRAQAAAEVAADEANRNAAIGAVLRGIGAAIRPPGATTVCQPLVGGGSQCYRR